MEPTVDFRKANTEPSVHFRRANTETYQKQNVNLSKRVGKDGVFLGLAGLLLGISLGLRPQEIPRSSPTSPRKTPSFPPLLLRLTQSCWNSVHVLTYKYQPAYIRIPTRIVLARGMKFGKLVYDPGCNCSWLLFCHKNSYTDTLFQF